jgi:hypothetical protein
VKNLSKETVGHIQDLIIDRQGHVSSALIDVGTLSGNDHKVVAVQFVSLSIDADADRNLSIVAQLEAAQLADAPTFQPTDRSVVDRFKVRAADMGQTAVRRVSDLGKSVADTASDLAHRAAKRASTMGEVAGKSATDLKDKSIELKDKSIGRASDLARKVVQPLKSNDPASHDDKKYP